MPRVHTMKASKDYPNEGIKKGDTYYKWKCFRQSPQRSKTYPRHSQLSGAKYAAVLDAVDDARKAVEKADNPEDIESAVQEAGGVARDIASEYEDAISSMESAIQGSENSPIAEDMREKQEALEAWADEAEGFDLGQAQTDWEALGDEPADADEGEAKEDAREKWETERADLLQEMRDSALATLDELEIG